MKVIETNLSLNEYNEVMDVQSRVIEVESWDLYIKEIINLESVNRKCILGTLVGNSMPKNAIMSNLKYTNGTLVCDVTNSAGQKTKKVAYLVYKERK